MAKLPKIVDRLTPAGASATYASKAAARALLRRIRPGGNVYMRTGTEDAQVMASPPTVTQRTATAIASPRTYQLTTPTALAGATAAGCTLVGPVRFLGVNAIGLVSSASAWTTTLAANAAAGASSVSVAASVPTGTYRLQPWVQDRDLNAGESVLHGEFVTVTAVAGSGPYTLTLSAPLAHAHYTGDSVITNAVPTSNGPGSGVGGIGMRHGSGAFGVMEFLSDAQVVDIGAQFQQNAAYRIWVDGEVATAASVVVGTGTISQNYAGVLSIDLGSAGMRRIRVEISNIYPFAVYTAQTATVCPVEEPIRTIFVGDSYLSAPDGIEDQVARLLGLDPPARDAIGGTGYTTTSAANLGGTPGNAIKRLYQVLSYDPHLVILCLGLNDDQALAAQVQADVTTYLTALLAGLSAGAHVVALGPWAVSNSNNTAKAPVATAIKNACDGLGVPYIDTILGLGPAPNPWVYGTGNTGAPAGDGNADAYINSDGTHPNTKGLRYNATRIASGILDSLGV